MPNAIRTLPQPAVARLATGLGQGVLLYLLYRAAAAGAWPASHGLIFAPLLMVAWFVPLILLVGLGNLHRRRLVAWILGAAVVLAGLAVHDLTRGAEFDRTALASVMGGSREADIWPSPNLVFFSAVGLFIAQALVVAGDGEGRVIAPYPAYFDAAWKAAVQVALAVLFVGLFWLLLWLGAGLFKLIDITFFETLIQRRWFAMPATTLALAAALHVSDTRAGIVRSLRGLIHVLLSWLLPLLTVVVAGFLASLPFTGLAPLWRTRFATGLLLLTASALVALINAAYEDGERTPAPVLRHAGSLAALMLVPLVAMAAYALGLRVDQHGWSGDRVIGAAFLVVAACYALGYAVAALVPGAWLKRIEPVNLAGGVVLLAVLLAVFSPLADPARIAVASQVARLEAGVIPPDQFDFAYLRFDGARYGRAALERLKAAEGPNAAVIREQVEVAERLTSRWNRHSVAPNPSEMAQSITVHPRGRTLPDGFLTQNWSSPAEPVWQLPECLQNRGARCDAFLIDLTGGGLEDVVVMDPLKGAVAFHQDGAGRWHVVGTFSLRCAGVRPALEADDFKVVAPEWRDLEVAGARLHLYSEACP